MEQLQDSSSSESELSMSTAVSLSSCDSVPSISTSGSSLSDSKLSSSKSLQPSVSESSVSTISFSSPPLYRTNSLPTFYNDVWPTITQLPCYYDPSTSHRQRFSIPEKIVYYLAKNCTNAETFQKLVETCKYFFKVNPVVVVPSLINSSYRLWGTVYYRWSVCNNGKTCFQFSDPQTINFKIWLTHKFIADYLNPSKLIPKIYRNDATFICLRTNDQDITWKEFLVLAGNAETLYLSNRTIKYENGKAVTLERIVENLTKLKDLNYSTNGDGSDITSNTFSKLIEMEHFKNITHLSLCSVPEELNLETIFYYILENKHVEIYIRYRSQISDACKERIREYSNRLKNENGCNSNISYFETYYGVDDGVASISSFEESESSEDNDSDVFSDSFDDDEEVLFPWNNEDEEGWELPWDI